MKKCSGVLFDFNGTLFFDSEMHMEALRRVFPRFGKPTPTDAYILGNVFGRPNEIIYRQNFKADATAEECMAFCHAKDALYYEQCLAHPERMHLAQGAEALLDHLKENEIPYCLATGSAKTEVDFYMEHLNLSRWFSWDNMVYQDGTFPGKPAPDCYRLAAERIGLSTAECLVFEDSVSGIRAAQSAGVGGIIAVYAEKFPSPVSEDTPADAVYHDFTDWKAIIENYGF